MIMAPVQNTSCLIAGWYSVNLSTQLCRILPRGANFTYINGLRDWTEGSISLTDGTISLEVALFYGAVALSLILKLAISIVFLSHKW